MKRAAIAIIAVLGGCSQLLGLEDTRFDQRDAMTDAQSVCDGAPRCTGATGRSVCGQLYGTGAQGGQLLRASEPTGETCASSGSTTGPCAFAVHAQSTTSYFAANAAELIAGEIDDCGRFVVLDVDIAAANVAVVVTGTDIIESATLLLDRETTVGFDVGLVAPVVSIETAIAWGTQLSSASPPDFGGGYLVTYENATGEPIATEELRVNGGAVGAPPTQPWGGYFSGAVPFGTLDPAQLTTQASGTAVVVPAAASFQLGGFRPGKNCTPLTLQPVANALIHVTLSC